VKLIKTFEPSDQVAKVEQTAKLLSLKLKKGEDLTELELRIALGVVQAWVGQNITYLTPC
jgi:hypothetical protein